MVNNMADCLVLGIETSCDETAAAVMKNGREPLSNVIASQIGDHAVYGGVVPEIASREHVAHISQVVDRALAEAGVSFSGLDAIAVTKGPGLVGALLVGVSYAKALAFACRKPLIGVNHIEAHMFANYIKSDFAPPYLCLVVSGGHTHLVDVRADGRYEVVSRTVDDAAGEAYDKVARAIGLGYPGGPAIDRLARQGDADAVPLPRAVVADRPGYFSFSGLKSAVLQYLLKRERAGQPVNRADLAASFQKAVVDVLVGRAMEACRERGVNTLALAGGVSANSGLRREMARACEAAGIRLQVPELVLCTDNACMVAACGTSHFLRGERDGWDMNAYPSLALG